MRTVKRRTPVLFALIQGVALLGWRASVAMRDPMMPDHFSPPLPSPIPENIIKTLLGEVCYNFIKVPLC